MPLLYSARFWYCIMTGHSCVFIIMSSRGQSTYCFVTAYFHIFHILLSIYNRATVLFSCCCTQRCCLSSDIAAH